MTISPFITICDVAIAWGAKADPNAGINGAEFARLGLPMLGGCYVCEASIAAFNASPTKTGYLACTKTCTEEDTGFRTVQEFNEFIKQQPEPPEKERFYDDDEPKHWQTLEDTDGNTYDR